MSDTSKPITRVYSEDHGVMMTLEEYNEFVEKETLRRENIKLKRRNRNLKKKVAFLENQLFNVWKEE